MDPSKACDVHWIILRVEVSEMLVYINAEIGHIEDFDIVLSRAP